MRRHVQALVQEAGMTQRFLARKLDISESTMSRWLSGDRKAALSTDELDRLHLYLDELFRLVVTARESLARGAPPSEPRPAAKTRAS